MGVGAGSMHKLASIGILRKYSVRWPHKWSFGSGPAALSGPISKAPGFAGDIYFDAEYLFD
jgi:hypothetical protein